MYKYRYNPVHNIRKGGFEEFCIFSLSSCWKAFEVRRRQHLQPLFPILGLRGPSKKSGRCEKTFNHSLCGFLRSLEATRATATKKPGVLSPSTLNIHQLSGVFPLPSVGQCSPAFRASIPPGQRRGLIQSGSKPTGHGTSLSDDAVTDPVICTSRPAVNVSPNRGAVVQYPCN